MEHKEFRAVIDGKEYYFDMVDLATAMHSNIVFKDCGKFKERMTKVSTWLIAGNKADRFTGVIYDKIPLYENDKLKITNPSGITEIVPITFEEGGFIIKYDFGEFYATTIGWALEQWFEGEDFEIEIIKA